MIKKVIELLSKREHSLNHRHPTGHARGVRSKASAVRNFENPHELAAEPQPLGRKEKLSARVLSVAVKWERVNQ